MTDVKKNAQFVPFSSTLDIGFWNTLSSKKLEEFGLKDDHISITGGYRCDNALGLPCLLHVDYTAFNSEMQRSASNQLVNGDLKNTNTLDEFKTCDKSIMLNQSGEKIWNSIMDGSCLEDPSVISRFMLLTFANLKKYIYHYWFAFPALTPPGGIILQKPVCSLTQAYSDDQIKELLNVVDDSGAQPFFAVYTQNGGKMNLLKLSEEDAINKLPLEDITFIFRDPSTMEKYPGWPLRNYLCLISKHFVREANSTVRIVGFRDRTANGERNVSHSVYIECDLSPLSSDSHMWKVVGWEKDPQGKLLPRSVNLSKSMNPEKLAESAVDLNLKLMRWRLLPELDLPAIAQTRCLLLGAGTLGCNVARNLLGWGVRTITFVDNSTISYSNPVRQSLFTFEDCTGGGKPKAQAAADNLKRIFPGVNAQGVSLNIPMPGHSVNDVTLKSVESDVQMLDKLIEDHDAIFLLMDTRESRWLPTVMGAAKQKIVLTAALGFDTWLCMRHGSREVTGNDNPKPNENAQSSANSFSTTVCGSDLGCYYCNDVVAPRDSTKDRTLDQQCTVSRPGLSMLCSALIVELLVSILQHPERNLAPAVISEQDEDSEDGQCILGVLPHQIRGFLSRYQLILPVSRRFEFCTACSDLVISKFKEQGFQFLLKAFNDPNYLEDITGLTAIHNNALASEVVSDFEDGDDW